MRKFRLLLLVEFAACVHRQNVKQLKTVSAYYPVRAGDDVLKLAAGGILVTLSDGSLRRREAQVKNAAQVLQSMAPNSAKKKRSKIPWSTCSKERALPDRSAFSM